MTNTKDLEKLDEQLTRWQNKARILTAVIETQQAEIQRLRAINARLMAAPRSGSPKGAKKRKSFMIVKARTHLN